MNTATQPFVILLVEDENTDAYLVKWALGENRIMADFHHAYDGYEALAFLRRLGPSLANAPRPDLILLDLSMPSMGGLECLAAIKQDSALSDIPVVVLTTSHAKSDMDASRNLGAVDYFTKPMDIHQLVETMRVLGERWITPRATAQAHIGGESV
jgi:CheY-like chemotaxis protein